MTKLYLGIDLGGTEVKMAVVDEKGTIVERSSFPNSYGATPKSVVEQIVMRARAMKNYEKLEGTGVGVAGDIDQSKGIVRFSPNLREWVRTPFRKMLEAGGLPKPVVIDNDANAAALGAYWLDGKGAIQDFVCVTLGTGVGGGLVLNGKLYRGATGTAGEIGHMTIEPEGPRCKCGNSGCIERYLGARYLSEEAKIGVRAGKSKTMEKLVDGKLNDITPAVISRAAKMGDLLAIQIWEKAGERLGIILADIVNLLNPQMIVLAGGVSQAGSLVMKSIKETVKARAFATPVKACKIVVSKNNRDLGVVGAALLAK